MKKSMVSPLPSGRDRSYKLAQGWLAPLGRILVLGWLVLEAISSARGDVHPVDAAQVVRGGLQQLLGSLEVLLEREGVPQLLT